MSDAVILRSVDWPLLTQLRDAAERDPDDLRDALESARPFDDDVAGDDPVDVERRDDITWPRQYRRNPSDEGAGFSAWLSAVDAERRDDMLMAASFSSGTTELPQPDYVVLAWFSALYVPVAVGIPGSTSSAGAPYDGPTVLPIAMASQLAPGDDAFALHDAGATKTIADALRFVRLEDGGLGPIALLYDFDEDSGTSDGSLDEGIEESLDLLQIVYADAAAAGHGVLVLNG